VSNVACFRALGWKRYDVKCASDGVRIYERVWMKRPPPWTGHEIETECQCWVPDFLKDFQWATQLVQRMNDEGWCFTGCSSGAGFSVSFSKPGQSVATYQPDFCQAVVKCFLEAHPGFPDHEDVEIRY